MSVNKANQLEVLRQCISELKAENAELKVFKRRSTELEAENFNLKREVANLRKELGNRIEELEKNREDAESRLAKVEQDSSVVNEHQSNNVSSSIENEQESPVVDDQSRNVKEAKRVKLEKSVDDVSDSFVDQSSNTNTADDDPVKRVTSSEQESWQNVNSPNNSSLNSNSISEKSWQSPANEPKKPSSAKSQEETEIETFLIEESSPPAVQKIPYNQKVEQGLRYELSAYTEGKGSTSQSRAFDIEIPEFSLEAILTGSSEVTAQNIVDL
ncbi:hypothetical protein RhiirC2_790367 [Rhizophagus irregularis]|uniref:Uncharacterized protein n=1 Tax=Rhizophagus irregularis TaxID=588596 RepID=A0A2N1MLF9_9GLOM|nr:hypothetical protein RhiirC2_790367 [Rhizophagus irregularis]